MSMLHVVQAISSTDLSFGAVLDCTDLSLDGLVSLSQCCRWRCCPRLGFSSYTISVGMCVPTVFDVNDAKFLVALHCHFLMTCGQHVVRECSFCVAMSLPAGIVIGVPSSPMNIQSVATFDTPPRLDSWCGLSLPLARTQCLHQLRNGGFVNSCCATPTSLGNTGTFPGLGGTHSVWSKPINNLTPPFSDIVSASCVGSLPIHHHHAHTQCGCH